MLHIPHNVTLVKLTADLTNEEFAKVFTGTTAAMVKSYQSGKAKPSSLFIEQLAEFAGVTERDIKSKKLVSKELKINAEKVEKAKKEKKGDVVTVTRSENEQSQEIIELTARMDVLIDYVLKMKAELHNRELKKVFDEFLHDFEKQLQKLKK